MIQFKVTHIQLNTTDKWQHDEWKIEINGEIFSYKTGLGHRKFRQPRGMYRTTKWDLENSRVVPPSMDSVIESLLLDESCASESFEDFCGNMGYDTDSRKALEIYLDCQSNSTKIRKALGADFEAVKQRIEAQNDC